jgi:hypothetical protein
MSTWITFDCETLACEDAEQYIEAGEAPSNYKDPVKIAAYIEEQRKNRLEKAAADIDLARLLCGSFLTADGHVSTHTAVSVRGNYSDAIEAACVNLCLNELASADIVIGFYLDFDLPLLLRRAQLLGLSDVPTLDTRYKHMTLVQPETGYQTRVLDLANELTWKGTVSLKSLDFYARRFGCPHTTPFGGSDIAGLYADGRMEDIIAKNVTDVQQTAWLAKRLGLVRSTPTLHAVGA